MSSTKEREWDFEHGEGKAIFKPELWLQELTVNFFNAVETSNICTLRNDPVYSEKSTSILTEGNIGSKWC